MAYSERRARENAEAALAASNAANAALAVSNAALAASNAALISERESRSGAAAIADAVKQGQETLGRGARTANDPGDARGAEPRD